MPMLMQVGTVGDRMNRGKAFVKGHSLGNNR